MERQPLSDPMPDNLADRKALEAELVEMAAGEKAEKDRIAADLQAGDFAQDKLDELDGSEEAERIIGQDAVEDLKEIAARQDPNEVAQKRETRIGLEIMKMRDEGKSPQEIIDHYGGMEELERLIGPIAVQGFKTESRDEMNQKGEL